MVKDTNSYQKYLYREILGLISIRNLTTRILNQSNLVLLYLSHNEVLILVKVRQAIIERDGCYGYVNIANIKRVDKNYIHMIGCNAINYCENKRSFKDVKKNGQAIERKF